jgi:hypothetical protein
MWLKISFDEPIMPQQPEQQQAVPKPQSRDIHGPRVDSLPGAQHVLPGYHISDFPSEHLNYKNCAVCKKPMSPGEVTNHTWWIDTGEKSVLVDQFGEHYKHSLEKRPVCKTCAEEFLTQCESCGEIIYNEDAEVFEEEQKQPWPAQSILIPHYFCEDCFDDLYKQCISCDKTKPKEDMTDSDITGESYCESCYAETFTSCDHCGEEILSEDAQHCKNDKIFCESCYESECNPIGNMWAEFYHWHQEYEEKNVLDKASMQQLQDPQVYIDIFNDLSWNDQYGGEKWAEIAKTWRELLEIRGTGLIPPSKFREAVFWIDHAFDLKHNTGSLLTKIPDDVKRWLHDALDTKRDWPSPEYYRDKTSVEVQSLMKIHHQMNPLERSTWLRRLYDVQQDTITKGIQQLKKSIETENMSKVKEVIDKYNLTISDIKDIKDRIPARVLMDNFHKNNSLAYNLSRFLSKKIDSMLMGVLYNILPQELKNILKEDFEPFIEIIEDNITNITDTILAENFSHNNATLNEWHRFFQHRNKEKLLPPPPQKKRTTADSQLWHKFANLTQEDFYNFYALTTIDCSILGGDQRYCYFIKSHTITKVADDVIAMLQRAVVREARHVDNEKALIY